MKLKSAIGNLNETAFIVQTTFQNTKALTLFFLHLSLTFLVFHKL